MPNKQFILVVYDISNDKRRTKLHSVLLDFGSPVQFSVFECLLTNDNWALLKKAVMRVIKPKVDQVRFYWICKNCLRKVEITSGIEVLQEDGPAVIIGEDGD